MHEYENTEKSVETAADIKGEQLKHVKTMQQSAETSKHFRMNIFVDKNVHSRVFCHFL